MRYPILLSVIAIGLMACEKEIPLDAEVTTSKLVINAAIQAGENWDVHISNSLSVIDNGYTDGQAGASVGIYDSNGTLIEQLQDMGYGQYYGSATTSSVGVDYTVKASKSGFDPVEATDRIPLNASISFVDTTRTKYLGENVMEILVDITDPSGEDNYYLLSLAASDSFGSIYGVNFYVNAPEFENTTPDSYNNQAYLLDNSFQGSTFRARLFVEEYWFDNVWQQFNTMTLNVRSVSEAGYEYARTYDAFQQTSGNPFAQPVQVYSNVTDGFGIFAGANFNYLEIQIN